MKHVFGENLCRDLGFLSVQPRKTHSCANNWFILVFCWNEFDLSTKLFSGNSGIIFHQICRPVCRSAQHQHAVCVCPWQDVAVLLISLSPERAKAPDLREEWDVREEDRMIGRLCNNSFSPQQIFQRQIYYFIRMTRTLKVCSTVVKTKYSKCIYTWCFTQI